MTPGIVDFLLARIAEDEAAARANGPCRATLAVTEQDEDEPDYSDCEQRSGHRTDHGTLGGLSWSAHEPGAWAPARVLAKCAADRLIVEFHKSWPVLVEQQPEFAAQATELNDMTYRMTRQIAWVTQEEYRKRFGEEPPTTPMLRALALPYADHPDYDESWRP